MPYTKEAALKAGGKYWEKGDKKRVYFNLNPADIGLRYALYKSGWIKTATLDNKPISNSEARRILSALRDFKVYLDLEDGEIKYSPSYIISRYADMLVDAVRKKLEKYS